MEQLGAVLRAIGWLGAAGESGLCGATLRIGGAIIAASGGALNSVEVGVGRCRRGNDRVDRLSTIEQKIQGTRACTGGCVATRTTAAGPPDVMTIESVSIGRVSIQYNTLLSEA